MDFQAYIFAEQAPRKQISWSHPQLVLVEEARLGWDRRTSGAHLIQAPAQYTFHKSWRGTTKGQMKSRETLKQQ